ncbi:hypothetical protein ACLOJK_028630 [Asimina triloba]
MGVNLGGPNSQQVVSETLGSFCRVEFWCGTVDRFTQGVEGRTNPRNQQARVGADSASGSNSANGDADNVANIVNDEAVIILDVKDDIRRIQKDFDFWHLGHQMIKFPGGDGRVVDKTMILSGTEKGCN